MTIRGVLPVVQIPYNDDESIDFATFEKEVDWLFDCGVNGIVYGMVSEVLRCTETERDELVRAGVKFARGRGPVVASAGGESIQQAVRHGKAAEQAGAAALMITPPALTRCSSDEITRYYASILSATTLPIIVQDASGYIGNAISIATQAELYRRHPERILFKPEAPPFGANLSALRDATGGNAAIFEGTGGVALMDSYRRGIQGTMPGADMPWAFVKLWKALELGDEVLARRIHLPIAALISMMTNLDSFLAMEKLFLVKQGIFKSRRVRGPVGFKLDSETELEWLRLFELLLDNCRGGDRIG